ncbi:MAG: hypothetical protein AB7G39_12805 [Alphaproteobacteria bacterium]
MSGKRDGAFLVVGLVRNCERSLGRDVERLRTALGDVRALHWFLVESDSTDRTVRILESLRATVGNFDFRSLGDLTGVHPRRTERLAFCRNVYAKAIRDSETLRDIDYVIVADFDGINAAVTPGALASCWDTRIDWDMCAANQAGPYYDIWALRHETWSPNDCWEQYRFLNRFNGKTERNIWSAVYAKMITIPGDHAWIEVDSAFGGLAIYRKSLFQNAEYEGVSENGEEICEHVSLHSSMRKSGAKMFINPRLINSGYNEHSRVLRPARRIVIRTKSLLRRFVTQAFRVVAPG